MRLLAAGSTRSQGWPVRWSDVALLHRALKFYAQVPPERSEATEREPPAAPQYGSVRASPLVA